MTQCRAISRPRFLGRAVLGLGFRLVRLGYGLGVLAGVRAEGWGMGWGRVGYGLGEGIGWGRVWAGGRGRDGMGVGIGGLG